MGAPFCLPRMRGDRPFKLRFRRVVFSHSRMRIDLEYRETIIYDIGLPACAIDLSF